MAENRGIAEAPEGGREAVRKHLQNDELVDYALDHSGLFYPYSR
jgi:hypothetical protein